jgi:putative addiction module component (TIGR02574 family)
MSDVQLPSEILKLSVVDRMESVTKIWESIAEDGATRPLSDAHAHILDQRLSEADADPGALIPADEVFRELRDK